MIGKDLMLVTRHHGWVVLGAWARGFGFSKRISRTQNSELRTRVGTFTDRTAGTELNVATSVKWLPVCRSCTWKCFTNSAAWIKNGNK